MLQVSKDKHRHGGLPVFVQDVEFDRTRRRAAEQNVHFAASPQVLGALAHIEYELRFTLSGVAAIQREDPVFQG